eukprot:12900445-Prorocentrum_lima.AAC.1
MNPMRWTTSHCIWRVVVDARPNAGVSSLGAITWLSPGGTGWRCEACASGTPCGNPPTPASGCPVGTMEHLPMLVLEAE